MRARLLVALLFMSLSIGSIAHAEDSLNGLTCGFVSTIDPNSQDLTAQTGEVDAHFSLHNSSGGLASMTVTCTIQVNTGVYGAGGVARSNTCDPANAAVSHVIVCDLVDAISYTAVAGDDVYLCTEIRWTSAKGGGLYQHDGDPNTAGNQCSLAFSAGDDGGGGGGGGGDQIVATAVPIQLDNDPSDFERVVTDDTAPASDTARGFDDTDADFDVVVVGTRDGAGWNSSISGIDDDPNEQELVVRDPATPSGQWISFDFDEDGDLDVIVVGIDGASGGTWVLNVDNDPEDEVVVTDPAYDTDESHGVSITGDGSPEVVVVGSLVGARIVLAGGIDNDGAEQEIVVEDPSFDGAYSMDLDGDGTDPDLVVVGTSAGRDVWYTGGFADGQLRPLDADPLDTEVVVGDPRLGPGSFGEQDMDGDQDADVNYVCDCGIIF